MRADILAAVCMPPLLVTLPLDMPFDELDETCERADFNSVEAWCELRDSVQDAAGALTQISGADMALMVAALEAKQHEAVVKLACLEPTADELAAVVLVCDPSRDASGEYLRRVGAESLGDLSTLQRQEFLLVLFDGMSGLDQGRRYADVRVTLGLPRHYFGGKVAFVGEATEGTFTPWGDGTRVEGHVREDGTWQRSYLLDDCTELSISAAYAAQARALGAQQ